MSRQTLLAVQMRSQAMAICALMGKPYYETRDVFGTRHQANPDGYCPCWQCPKFDGVQWWTPKPQPPFTRRELRKYGLRRR